MTDLIESDEPLCIGEISLLEESLYFVQRFSEALNLQMNRLDRVIDTSQSSDDFWNYLSDVHFYIVALIRLHKSILTGTLIDKINKKIKPELDRFEKTLESVKSIRHTLEHIDARLIQGTEEEKSLYYIVILDSDGRVEWAGQSFDRRKLQKSAGDIVIKYREVTRYEFERYQKLNDTNTGASKGSCLKLKKLKKKGTPRVTFCLCDVPQGGDDR